jgi:hypothetical protein
MKLCTSTQLRGYVNLLKSVVWIQFVSNEDFTKIYLAFFLFEGS